MSKIKHTLPIAAAAIVMTAGSIAGPGMIVTDPAVAEASTVTKGASAGEAPSAVRAASVESGSKARPGARAAATSPEQLLKMLGERIVAKDIDGIIALHEPEAAIVDWDGSVIRGRAAIRTFYLEWFASNPVLTVNPRQTVIAGGWRAWDNKVRQRTAAIMGDYSLEQDAADGTRESFTGNFCDTVQEQLDGTWLYVQDNPYPPHGDAAASRTAHH